jgi:hypothetical protein
MNTKLLNTRLLVIGSIILFAAVMRLLPHYPNFTPVAAIALFGGAHFSKRWLAFLVPLLALFVSDLIIGFHSFMLPVYLSFGLVVLMGGLLKGRIRPGTVIAGSLGASLLFFLITNFAVWIGSPYYPQTFAGLLSCYGMAIPFFHSGMLGDLFYSGVFFGGYYLVEQRYPVLKEV